MERLASFLDQRRSGLPFVFDDAGNHIANFIEDLRLALAERHLVGDLIKVPGRPASLAIETSHGQIDFLQRPKNFLDVLDHDQSGQVQHDAGPHAGADIGRASRQVAELFAESVTDTLLEQVVDLVNILPGLVEREAAAHDLKPQMIFLVDHEADGFMWSECDAAWSFGGGQLATNELPFHEKLPIQRRQRRHVQVTEIRVQLQLGDPIS